jgi:sec-independent protein translocase protein TatB
MLDIGWTEMLVIAVVAIVIIGPKDLPRTLRTVGRWIGKARGMAREFQNSLDDIARDTELDELKKQITEVSDFDVRGEIEQSFDPTGSAGALDGPPEPTAGETGPGEIGATASDGTSPGGAAATAPEPQSEAEPDAEPGSDEALKSEAHG